MNLILVVNKTKNITSRKVVNELSKILKYKKIGHTGTLDPMATGVLVCMTGKYTKLVDLIINEEKEYIATIKLGIKTDTGDITGSILEQKEIPVLDFNKIKEILSSFVGNYEETVPIYSAVHVNGKRLYEYARNKEEVILPKKIVEIKKIELISYDNDLIKFKVVVSKGAYIRSLIQDICKKLNTIGTMSELVRTKQGKFNIENAYTLEDVSVGKYQSLKLEDVLDLKCINVKAEILKKVQNGNKINMDIEGYVLFKDNSNDVALYYFENNIGKLKILF